MSNAWIDDNFYGQAWVRLCGPIAAHVYLAVTCLVHRDMPDDFGAAEAEIRDELPWDISDGDFHRAVGALVARGRLSQDGDRLIVTNYPIEQEQQEAQAGRRAKAIKANAAWLAKYKGRPKRAPSEEDAPQARSGRPSDASGPSLPIRPSKPSKIPPSAAPQASPSESSFDVVPHGTGTDLTESPQEQAMRFMLTPSTRNDGGVDRSWRFYAVRFVIATGGKPSYPTRHRKRWAELLRTHGVEEFCRRISIYFDDPPWKLREGARDFNRLIENFDLLAAGSGKTASRETGDATAKFKWDIRERIASLNGSAPPLAPEFASWVGMTGSEVVA